MRDVEFEISNIGQSSVISKTVGPPALAIAAATRIISRDSNPPGSVAVTPGAAELSITLKLKLRYCPSVPSQTRRTSSFITASKPRSNTWNIGTNFRFRSFARSKWSLGLNEFRAPMCDVFSGARFSNSVIRAIAQVVRFLSPAQESDMSKCAPRCIYPIFFSAPK